MEREGKGGSEESKKEEEEEEQEEAAAAEAAKKEQQDRAASEEGFPVMESDGEALRGREPSYGESYETLYDRRYYKSGHEEAVGRGQAAGRRVA